MSVRLPQQALQRVPTYALPPPRRPTWRSANGFTMLEIALVLFLMVGMLSLVIPRMSIGDSLGSVGRKWVGAMKSFQELAMMGQKTVRLYVDIDRGMYWPMVLDGKEEKIPLDPTLAMPITLPESIRFADVQVGVNRRETGRMEIFFYPNGRIDQAPHRSEHPPRTAAAVAHASLAGDGRNAASAFPARAVGAKRRTVNRAARHRSRRGTWPLRAPRRLDAITARRLGARYVRTLARLGARGKQSAGRGLSVDDRELSELVLGTAARRTRGPPGGRR